MASNSSIGLSGIIYNSTSYTILELYYFQNIVGCINFTDGELLWDESYEALNDIEYSLEEANSTCESFTNVATAMNSLLRFWKYVSWLISLKIDIDIYIRTGGGSCHRFKSVYRQNTRPQ